MSTVLNFDCFKLRFGKFQTAEFSRFKCHISHVFKALIKFSTSGPNAYAQSHLEVDFCIMISDHYDHNCPRRVPAQRPEPKEGP